jgi:hypothetical protein
MVDKAARVNQGDLLVKEPEFMDQVPKNRASRSQSAHKSDELCNGSGAKGRRKVDANGVER